MDKAKALLADPHADIGEQMMPTTDELIGLTSGSLFYSRLLRPRLMAAA